VGLPGEERAVEVLIAADGSDNLVNFNLPDPDVILTTHGDMLHHLFKWQEFVILVMKPAEDRAPESLLKGAGKIRS